MGMQGSLRRLASVILGSHSLKSEYQLAVIEYHLDRLRCVIVPQTFSLIPVDIFL